MLDDASHFRRICAQLEACPGQQANESELKERLIACSSCGGCTIPVASARVLREVRPSRAVSITCSPPALRLPLPSLKAVLRFPGQCGHFISRQVMILCPHRITSNCTPNLSVQAVLGFRGQRGHRVWRRVKPALAKKGNIEEILARTETDKAIK